MAAITVADLANALQNLNHAIIQLTHDNTTATNNLNTLTTQVANLATIQPQPAAAAPATGGTGPHTKKTARPPTEFDGDIQKGVTFIQELQLYFANENFTDGQKITIALSYLTGEGALE